MERYTVLSAIVDRAITDLAPEAAALSDWMAANPELGEKEFEASRRMSDFLKKTGFDVEYPFMDIPTAYRGITGRSQGPVVALLAEYDALPEIGHACGHCLHGCMTLLAGAGLARVMSEIGGSLWVVGTPSEETNGAKVTMSQQGIFNGVSLAMMIHSLDNSSFVRYRSLAMDALEFSFTGRPAHAAGSPWEGINALNGVQLLFHAIDMLRQHVRPEVRMHGIVVDGGTAPNIVPETASARFYFRAPKRKYLDEIIHKVHDCARGAALATGTEVKWNNVEFSFDDMLPNDPAESMMEEVFDELGISVRSADGSLGSSDMGNVSYACPALQPELSIMDEPAPCHTREFAAAVVQPRAHEAMITGARALARASLRTFLDENLRRRMAEELERQKLAN